MLKDIKIIFKDKLSKVSDVSIPNYCPHCGKTLSPHIWGGFSLSDSLEENKAIGILAQCTDENCLKFFALEFYKNNYKQNWRLESYSYRPNLEITLPEHIEKVSPSYVEIYKQAVKAESENLDQIAGMGYRKALEFLIKDFAIYKNPDEEEKIAVAPLAKVINTYYSDFPKIKSLALASAWIGNDETHYVRKHENLDINVLKSFILSVAHFISGDISADIASGIIDNLR